MEPGSAAAKSITTRLIIDRTRRGTDPLLRLAITLLERGVAHGMMSDFNDCNDHLVWFFQHLGCRKLRRVRHPDYGRVTVMKLDLRDVAHFKQIGSLFVAVRVRRTRVA